jgi:hypothetical protein
MKRFIIITMGLICFLTTGSALATDPGAKLTQVAGIHAKNARQTPGNLEIPATSPMLTEIQAVMDSARVRESRLRLEYAPDQTAELALAVAELKKTTRLQVLDIQLRFARQDGRTHLERRIMASIEDLLRPAAPGGPRPVGGFVAD